MKCVVLAAMVLFCWTGACLSSELVYTPINPSFGGNPLNGSFLLSSASAQNKFREETPPLSSINPMQSFQDTLTRSLLSMLAGKIADASFGNGTIASDIPYEFGGYSILVHDQGNSMLVSITDPYGSQTSMTIGRFSAPSTAQPAATATP
jgi:curli production assembly/transport component CsgF